MNKTEDLKKTLQNCIQACLHCSDACLGEENVSGMVNCIRTDRECAIICQAVLNLLALDSSRAKDLVKVCAEMCGDCAAECEKHQHDHCRACAEACRKCEEACHAYLT